MNIDTKNKRKSRSLAKQITPEYIQQRARGMRRDESMAEVYRNIVHNPHVTISDPDKSGKSDILYDGKNIGWVDVAKGLGWINDKQYDKYMGHGHAANYPVAEEEYEDDEEYEDADEDDDQPIEESTEITADDDVEEVEEWADNIEDALRSELSYGKLLEETLQAISSETGDFIEQVFMSADDFFELNSKADVKQFVMDFYNGYDLDSREDHANPNRKYFRRDDKNHIESTNYPQDVYLDEALDDVIDHILDNLDDRYYPQDVLEIIDHYTEEIEEE